MNTVLDGIKRAIEAIGRAASLLILVIIAAVTFEVVSRYAFNAPTSWAWVVNKQLFGVFVLIAGGYTLVQKSHIRIEMLYEHYPPAMKTLVRWLTLLAALCFLGSLLWKSTVMGLDAWQSRGNRHRCFQNAALPPQIVHPGGPRPCSSWPAWQSMVGKKADDIPIQQGIGKRSHEHRADYPGTVWRPFAPAGIRHSGYVRFRPSSPLP